MISSFLTWTVRRRHTLSLENSASSFHDTGISECFSSEDGSDEDGSEDEDEYEDEDAVGDTDNESSITLGSDTTDGETNADSEWYDNSDVPFADLSSETSVDSGTSEASELATDESMEDLEPYPVHSQRAVRFEATNKQTDPTITKTNYYRRRALTPPMRHITRMNAGMTASRQRVRSFPLLLSHIP